MTPLSSWRQLHERLAQLPHTSSTLAGLATYYHCVHKAFAQTQDAIRTNHLVGHLMEVGEQLRDGPWTTLQLNQACALAWLYGHQALPTANAGVLLAQVDEALTTHAHALLSCSDAASRRNLLHSLRYLSLRLPGPNVQRNLCALLLHYTQQPVLRLSVEPWSLGLSLGLTGELLLLLRLQQLPGVAADIRRYVREGLVHLLAFRRDVDFAERRYSVFPYQLTGLDGEKAFSEALTWQHGDLSPVLLLYQAQELLQDPELTRIAELLGLNTLLRTTPSATLVTTAYFQTGAAGVAHLYYKLYAASRLEAYRTGYEFWLSQTQHLLQQDLTCYALGQDEECVFNGLVGTGLVLLSATATRRLNWDVLVG